MQCNERYPGCYVQSQNANARSLITQHSPMRTQGAGYMLVNHISPIGSEPPSWPWLSWWTTSYYQKWPCKARLLDKTQSIFWGKLRNQSTRSVPLFRSKSNMWVQDSPGGGAAGGDHARNQRTKGQQPEGQAPSQGHWYVPAHTDTHRHSVCSRARAPSTLKAEKDGVRFFFLHLSSPSSLSLPLHRPTSWDPHAAGGGEVLGSSERCPCKAQRWP